MVGAPWMTASFVSGRSSLHVFRVTANILSLSSLWILCGARSSARGTFFLLGRLWTIVFGVPVVSPICLLVVQSVTSKEK
jgi:hypothetical protein